MNSIVNTPSASEGIPSENLAKYRRHLHATAAWLERSIRPDGGSAAHFSPLLGWSRSYPETTGYLIPTLLELSSFLEEPRYNSLAVALGDWLLSIQLENGAWQGGLYHPKKAGEPSVFNTGQILKGMSALYRDTGEQHWIDAASRGAHWLAEGVGKDGYWPSGDYQSEKTPSYYTHVAWPMLAVAVETGSTQVREAASLYLQTVLDRQRNAGDFEGWSFAPGKAAFTHTIAYTIRGLQEAANLLGGAEGEQLWEACRLPLEKLCRHAEIYNGRLPGAYGKDWKPDRGFTCLTGNAQVAICLLLWEERIHDVQLVNAAAKLVDDVCRSQSLGGLRGVRGGVSGSRPLWQRYMRMRYPNWAAKYHCDALMRLMNKIQTIASDNARPE